ncbi:MAG TPA: hypothetical protein VGC93_02195 [Thermoanaerobaculia bacterium]
MKTAAILCLAYLVPIGADAQVEARQATPADLADGSEVVEVPSPMLLEVSLGGAGKPGNVGPLNQLRPGSGRVIFDTRKYVCDKARVERLKVVWREAGAKRVKLEVTPTISTQWLRQDIQLTVALVADGKVLDQEIWEDLTVGSEGSAAHKMGAVWASSSKSPTAVFSLPRAQFDSLFADGKAPLVRLVLNIED